MSVSLFTQLGFSQSGNPKAVWMHKTLVNDLLSCLSSCLGSVVAGNPSPKFKGAAINGSMLLHGFRFYHACLSAYLPPPFILHTDLGHLNGTVGKSKDW